MLLDFGPSEQEARTEAFKHLSYVLESIVESDRFKKTNPSIRLSTFEHAFNPRLGIIRNKLAQLKLRRHFNFLKNKTNLDEGERLFIFIFRSLNLFEIFTKSIDSYYITANTFSELKKILQLDYKEISKANLNKLEVFVSILEQEVKNCRPYDHVIDALEAADASATTLPMNSIDTLKLAMNPRSVLLGTFAQTKQNKFTSPLVQSVFHKTFYASHDSLIALTAKIFNVSGKYATSMRSVTAKARPTSQIQNDFLNAFADFFNGSINEVDFYQKLNQVIDEHKRHSKVSQFFISLFKPNDAAEHILPYIEQFKKKFADAYIALKIESALPYANPNTIRKSALEELNQSEIKLSKLIQ